MIRYSCHPNVSEKVLSSSLNRSSVCQNENGMVTAVALLLIAVLTLLGTAAIVVTSTDIQIGGNYKVSDIAFYAAEAGVEEARARLRSTAGANLITDTSPTSTQWRAYIGPPAMAQKGTERCQVCVGFDSSKATHSRKDSLAPSMNYVVEIKHKTDKPDGTGNIMYWGDDNNDGIVTRNTTAGNSNNRNIYLVTSSGYIGNSFQTVDRTVEAEISRAAPIPVPSPLYVKADSTIQGNTHIIGKDQCGGTDKHGVTTTKNSGSVNINGNSTEITGVNADPDIVYNAPNLDITGMVNSLKTLANFPYNVSSKTDTGMNWGTPTPGATQQEPSICSVHNVVYYNTSGTYIKLAGGSSGCGILLVDGDLEVNGGFAWNGIILVTGSVKYTGGGNDSKQITGSMLSGGTVDADMVGGNTNIVYCSSAISSQSQNLPLLNLSWRDLRGGN